jgi:outer membrane receptor protein involved in Fe transport
VHDFGGAELTSITAYRYNKWTRGTDADYNNLDILRRAPDGTSFNQFKTFTQELRLQGELFGGRLDWLVGGYYANEKLKVSDNLAYGADYERFANCLLINGVLPTAIAPSPLATSSCINTAVAGGTLTALRAGPVPGVTEAQRQQLIAILPALLANPARPGFGSIAAAIGVPTATLNNVGNLDVYNQTANNLALFTHNIFDITDRLKLTLGLRYTREIKELDARFSDNNVICRSLLGSPLAALQQLACFNPAVPGGNFAPAGSKRKEGEFSGTTVISFKPIDQLLTYASYSRGYKAGGFNLDRAGLARQNNNGPVLPTASLNALQFAPEINNAFELGAKFNGRGIDINVAGFLQKFEDFQLNTFDGTRFIVENINACKTSLNGADIDNSPLTGRCTGDTKPGVSSRGVEVELFARPATDVAVNIGTTVVNTRYANDLVGTGGNPLTNALFQLPGRRLSNSSSFVGTGSLSFNPRVGNGGMRALFYVDARHQSSFNTGSDLDLEKVQPAYTVINGRIGIQGPDRRWAVELWAQNIFNEDYLQVAFDAFAQGSGTQRGVQQGFYPRSNQLFGAFLAEPRTYGLTVRTRL